MRAGEVRVGRDGPVALRPSQLVEPEAELLVDAGPRFVSRGGIKLENALEALGIDLAGRDCLDVGASTGGFTDCMLQRGAAAGRRGRRRLRPDRPAAARRPAGDRDRAAQRPRRSSPATSPSSPELAVIDVSFISLAKVLPAVAGCLDPEGELLAMVKPQFELGRERVGKGVVRDAGDRREAILGVAEAARGLGLAVRGFAPSGLPGPKGNLETFVWCARDGAGIDDLEAAIEAVEA